MSAVRKHSDLNLTVNVSSSYITHIRTDLLPAACALLSLPLPVATQRPHSDLHFFTSSQEWFTSSHYLVHLLPDVLFTPRALDGLCSPPLLLLRYVILKHKSRDWVFAPTHTSSTTARHTPRSMQYLKVRVRLPVVPLCSHLHAHIVAHDWLPHLGKQNTMSQTEDSIRLMTDSCVHNC